MDSLAPRPVPDDDDGPLKPPRGVTIATVLAVIAGVIYVLSGGAGVLTINAMMSDSIKQYNQYIDDCTAQFGGYGTSVITETSATGSMATCQSLTQMTGDDWGTFKTASIVVSVIFLAMGIAVLAAGLFLRRGAMWARRVIISVTIITMLAAMMLGMSSPIILAATLLLIIAVLLCYIGSGGGYFMRVKARKHA